MKFSASLALFAALAGLGIISAVRSRPACALEVPERPPARGQTVTELGKSILLVYQAKNGTYWFGSDVDGVYSYDGRTTTHFTTGDGLSNDRVREIKEDAAGDIYFSTLGGISRFDGQRFTRLTVAADNDVNDWKLEPGDLWFKGEPGKNGPYRYDGEALYSLEFPQHYMADEYYAARPRLDWSPYEVYHIYEDRRGHVWFGTSTFGVCRFDGERLSWMFEEHLTLVKNGGWFGFRSIFEDRTGRFWFCNSRYRYNISPEAVTGGMNDMLKYEREKGLDHSPVPDSEYLYFMSIIEDDNREMWLATHGLGVYRYDGQNLTHYPVKSGDEDVTLFSIYMDNQGDLWLGSHEHGAWKFNGQTFEQFRPGGLV